MEQNKNILADYHRLALVNIAVEDHPKLVAKDIEFKLPKPNYTIDTKDTIIKANNAGSHVLP